MSAEIQFEAGMGVEVGGGVIYLQFAKSAYICGFPLQILWILHLFPDSIHILRIPITATYTCILEHI